MGGLAESYIPKRVHAIVSSLSNARVECELEWDKRANKVRVKIPRGTMKKLRRKRQDLVYLNWKLSDLTRKIKTLFRDVEFVSSELRLKPEDKRELHTAIKEFDLGFKAVRKMKVIVNGRKREFASPCSECKHAKQIKGKFTFNCERSRVFDFCPDKV